MKKNNHKIYIQMKYIYNINFLYYIISFHFLKEEYEIDYEIDCENYCENYHENYLRNLI